MLPAGLPDGVDDTDTMLSDTESVVHDRPLGIEQTPHNTLAHRHHQRDNDDDDQDQQQQLQDDLVKITTTDDSKLEQADPALPPPLESNSRGGSLSTNPGEDYPPEELRPPQQQTEAQRGRLSDVTSVRSMPTVHVTDTEQGIASRRPSTAVTADDSHRSASPARSPPASPSSRTSTAQRAITAVERRTRNRSAMDGRTSSRLSGFLTNLIHRRDGGGPPVPPTPTSAGSTRRTQNNSSTTNNATRQGSAGQDVSDTTPASNDASRASSPVPPTRPTTPPPSLPPPTLRELGLNLSVLTSELSPSHFSTPPTSGAFLSPHYLLLCHAQGLDVLPLQSPPAMQPYALVRRVSFKSVVIMELRGVVVAIAGRRDGVRVYALEEVKKAVEWRMELEIRRERDKMRRDAPKSSSGKGFMSSVDLGNNRESADGSRKSSLNGTAESAGGDATKKGHRKSIASGPPNTLIARNATVKRPRAPSRGHAANSSTTTQPSDSPPTYSEATTASASLQQVLSCRTSDSSPPSSELDPPAPQPPSQPQLAQQRRESIVGMLTRAPSKILPSANGAVTASAGEDDAKREWLDARDASEDEAIDVVAAGSSGSQALDERTSASHQAVTGGSSPTPSSAVPRSPVIRSPASSTIAQRRQQSANRPANLDLSLSRANTTTTIVPPQPSPAPTLLSLRQALSGLDGGGGGTSPVEGAAGAGASTTTTTTTTTPAQQRRNNGSNDTTNDIDPDTPNFDEDDDDAGGGLSLAEMLSESRLPELPPAGTRRPQQPIFIMSSHPVATGDEDVPPSPRTTDSHPRSRSAMAVGDSSSSVNVDAIGGSGSSSVHTQTQRSTPTRRRRRWSVFDGVLSGGPSEAGPSDNTTALNASASSNQESTPASPTTPNARGRGFTRSQSQRSPHRTASASSTTRPSTAQQDTISRSATTVPPPPPPPPLPQPPLLDAMSTTSGSSSRSRFIPRIISNAFNGRRSHGEDGAAGGSGSGAGSLASQTVRSDGTGVTNVEAPRRTGGMNLTHAPPPKLEYVKLPGTKGALLVKAVETAKKSFLAILCGDNGEKVELFAGTYRTALGLSRTFILPDSPRSLELQLQGDDLVEVFLVFSQNVFGLEPATVRVREVRIGRAERRAARRRAREIRGEVAGADGDQAAEEDVNVNVSIGVSMSVNQESRNASAEDGEEPSLIPSQHPNGPSTPVPEPPSAAAATYNTTEETVSSAAHADEIVALATAQFGPYTTFQQLTFAPNFPLAAIADEYIIPPTYPDFLDYRATYEAEASGSANTDLTQIQFSPPGLPVPAPSVPSKWYYRDPKGVIHGPWKASLMQSWFKDGLLPLDLPVRREEDTEFTLLKDLRLQSVDPTHPFRPSPAPLNPQPLADMQEAAKPLLKPLSLLAQPKHFGPPALLFSSRGGHSTTIVDARGRSVLKGRFIWSEDGDDESKASLTTKMGDVKRLEAFDVEDRSVLVAMRQGGLEVVDLGDALLKPADESRTVLPQFLPPPSNTNRRSPFVWRMGTPVSSSPGSAMAITTKSKSSHLLTKKNSGAVKHHQAGKTGDSTTGGGDGGDSDTRDEVLFLGRKNDELYLCERNAGSFRILCLSPNTSSS